jgi:hypothetical protein
MPVVQHLDYYSFVVGFDIGKCESSNYFALFRDCFGFSGFLASPWEFLDHFASLAKNNVLWKFY